ncbi:MAG TPA: hypothetical protein PKW84_09870, partial [Fervidobacterium sp.]|nr:hypothetical protein [Fervidobacterium sp.]
SGNFVDFTTGQANIPKDTITTDINNCLSGIETIYSALEHGVIDQTLGTANSGISTSKGFEINNANGNKLYQVTSIAQLNYLKPKSNDTLT